jgi:4-hydroxybenzoate polyprenyltransferase
LNRLRTFLVLGRVSNLPTVWSNCLAGWWLGGGSNFNHLPYLLFGASFLYVGGMFLNDAFDAEFDLRYRKERPVPSGMIELKSVWRWGLGWLALGILSLACAGRTTAELGLVLAVCILLYDAIHKVLDFAPVLMGICRFLLYVVAASTGLNGVTGNSVWCGLALAAYIVGLSYVARRESRRDVLRYWPLVLLAAPVALAMIVDTGAYREGALLLSAVLGLWSLRCLRYTLWSEERDIGLTVSGLLAGIVFVDWLAVADAPNNAALVFLGLFLLALLLQKVVPAT